MKSPHPQHPPGVCGGKRAPSRASGGSRMGEESGGFSLAEYAVANPLHARTCLLCGRPRNPQLLSVCCFECEETMGQRHDARCELRTVREKESRIVPVSQGGKADEKKKCNVCGSRPVRIAIPHLSGICCLLCSNTSGKQHDEQCDQRTAQDHPRGRLKSHAKASAVFQDVPDLETVCPSPPRRLVARRHGSAGPSRP